MFEVTPELVLGPMGGFIIAIYFSWNSMKTVSKMRKEMREDYLQQLRLKDEQLDKYHEKYITMLEMVMRMQK